VQIFVYPIVFIIEIQMDFTSMLLKETIPDGSLQLFLKRVTGSIWSWESSLDSGYAELFGANLVSLLMALS